MLNNQSSFLLKSKQKFKNLKLKKDKKERKDITVIIIIMVIIIKQIIIKQDIKDNQRTQLKKLMLITWMI